VLLDRNPRLDPTLASRDPDRSCFVLVTPELFCKNPDGRLYGHLMSRYREDSGALARDLPHRQGVDFDAVSRRLGWLTWEDCNRVMPGAWQPRNTTAAAVSGQSVRRCHVSSVIAVSLRLRAQTIRSCTRRRVPALLHVTVSTAETTLPGPGPNVRVSGHGSSSRVLDASPRIRSGYLRTPRRMTPRM
jgi:hypothetical protein